MKKLTLIAAALITLIFSGCADLIGGPLMMGKINISKSPKIADINTP